MGDDFCFIFFLSSATIRTKMTFLASQAYFVTHSHTHQAYTWTINYRARLRWQTHRNNNFHIYYINIRLGKFMHAIVKSQ